MRLGLIINLILISVTFAGLWVWFSTQSSSTAPIFANKKVEDTSVKSYGGETDSVVSNTPADITAVRPNTSPAVPVPVVDTREVSAELISLKQAFASKYNKDVSSVVATIDDTVGNYIKGTVDFDNMGYAANFYALRNADNSWNIVAVENGVIACSTIDSYSFPTSLIPQCYSYATGAVVNR